MKPITLFLFFPFILISQENTENIVKKDNHTIHWKTNFIVESNSLNYNFLNTILYRGHITDDIKKTWIDNGNENNVVYSEIRNTLSYTYHLSKKSIGFVVSNVDVINANFTDDLLRLGFEGNFQYQNTTLNLSKTNIRASRFQQYKIKYESNINNIKINGGLSYLSGDYHVSYIIEDGYIYTAPFGSYLDISYNINAFITDTSDFSLFANNGNGLAIDFSSDFRLKKYNINISLTDIGFIIWNPSSLKISTDSTFNFQGVEIEDIFNFNDSILESNNLTDDVFRTNNTSFKSYIPATISFSISGKTKYNYFKNYTTGIIAKWQPYMDNEPLSFKKINQGFKESNFHPLFYITSNYNVKNYDLIPSLSYGGYSNDPNLGLALSKGQKNKLVLGAYHIEDLFSGEQAKALSLYFNIQLQF